MTLRNDNTMPDWSGRLLVLVYLVSGGAGLAYEILWTRMLSLQFGVSIFGVVATVAAFMFGLGAGSLLGLRWRAACWHVLRLFALLELFVAVSAVIMPSLFRLLDAELAGLAPHVGLSTWYGLQIAVVMLVLMLPALAMGAGFPLILSAVSGTELSLGRLYGANAVGGALGALLPLLLLPLLGWLEALYSVALISTLVAASAWVLSRSITINSDAVRALCRQPVPAWRWLALYGGIGAAALLLEIGWTRLFGMVLLRTEYVLAVILAVFLAGIGLGSLLAIYLRARYWLTLLPILAGTCAVLGLWAYAGLAAWAETARFDSLAQALWQQGLMITALTLPVTLVLGAWLPLFARHLGNPGHSGVWLYGANAIGAAIGTLLAGFVLIPWLGTTATVVCGAMLLLVLGLAWGQARCAWVAIVILAILAVPVWQMPSVNALLPAAHVNSRTLSLHEDAIAITHVVQSVDGQRQLLADLRRMDASTEPTAVVVQRNQVRLPLLLQGSADNVLLLGLGTGISASASMAWPSLSRSAVELSRGAIEAAQMHFTPLNLGVMEAMQVVRDDARHYLMSHTQTHDVIIGDLFHPDLVGRSALLSRQQFQRARARLSSPGVFVQWLALNQFDLDSLQVVLRSFREVFPDGVLFVDAFRLALVGTVGESLSAARVLASLQGLNESQQHMATGGEGPWTWLGRYWGRIPASDGPVQDEWAPVIEYRLPGARYSGDLDLARNLDWLLSIRPDSGHAAAALAVGNDFQTEFAGAYAATTLATRAWLATLHNRPQLNETLLPKAYAANPRDRWVGFALADAVLADRPAAQARGLSERQLLETVLRLRPDHVEALRALWQITRQVGETELAADYRARLQALSPLDQALNTVKLASTPNSGNAAGQQ